MVVLAVFLLIVSVLLQAIVHGLAGGIGFLRKVRTGLAWVTSAVVLGAAVCFLVDHINAFTLFLAFVSLYRIFNMMRVVKQRMHEDYQAYATSRTSMVLVAMQVVGLMAWWAWVAWHKTGHVTWGVFAGLQFIIACGSFASLLRNLKKTAWPKQSASYSDKELPTVTVAIPARNETDDLRECLQTVVTSDYPKLEIIVLDDCSQDKHTPEIIRDFAQSGVRFIQGGPADDTWQPKNWAYQRLADEASGDYVLFCGVDVRFKPQSVRQLVATALYRRKSMVSVLPRRSAEALLKNNWAVIQAVRYAWELVPPRRLFNRPPVLSTCWLIQTAAFKKLGGFKAVRRAITPEAVFARELTKSDSYSFLRANEQLGVESVKAGSDQFDTAVRTRYPQLHRRPEQVAFVALLELGFLLGPWLVVAVGFWVSIGWFAWAAAAVSAVLLSLTYAVNAVQTRVHRQGLALWAQPVAVLCDIILMQYSMWKYEFSTVTWKGRNVCIPVMHVVPRLPKL